MWKLLVILAVIKYNMLVFGKWFTPQRFQITYRILEHFQQILYLTGRIIRVWGPSRVLGPHKVLGPHRVLGPPRVLGTHRVLGPPRVLGLHRILGPRYSQGPGSRFSGMPLFLLFLNLLTMWGNPTLLNLLKKDN